MSKNTPTKSRVIQVKSITEFIDQDKEEDNEKINLKKKIDYREEINKNKEKLKLLKEQQNSILHETEEKIKQKKVAWKKEKELLVKKANEHGYNEGFTLGQKEGKKEYDALINKANEIVEMSKKDHIKTVKKSEKTIVQLAVLVAEKILNKKIEENPEQFSNIVQSVLLQLKESENVQIYVHPKFYEIILNKKEEYEELLRQNTHLQIFVDNQLNETDCIVEHTYGKVDASITTQINQLEETLMNLAMENIV